MGAKHVGEKVEHRHADLIEVCVVAREDGQTPESRDQLVFLVIDPLLLALLLRDEDLGLGGNVGQLVVEVVHDVALDSHSDLVESLYLFHDRRSAQSILGVIGVRQLQHHRHALRGIASVVGRVGARARIQVEIAVDVHLREREEVVPDVGLGTVRARLFGPPGGELHGYRRTRTGLLPVVGHQLGDTEHRGVSLGRVPRRSRSRGRLVVVARHDHVLLRMLRAGNDGHEIGGVPGGLRKKERWNGRARRVERIAVHSAPEGFHQLRELF